MQRTNDVEGMMSGVLEETLAIFGSDRAWLVYPCDPDAATSRVVMEHTHPEYPGAFGLGEQFPVDTQAAEQLRRVLHAPGAVTDLSVSPEMRERFSIQSIIAIAVRPKGDRPYLFGLHQCSHARVWTAAERRLFEETARRLEDTLTSVLAHRAVRESEARFRSLTELSSDWYWRQDEDLRFTYTSRQPEETAGYPSEWVIGKTRWELPDITPLSFTWPEHQAALAARQPFRDLEYARAGLDGMHYVSISGAPIFDEEGVFRGYQGIGRDITERRRVQEALRQSEERYVLAVGGSNEGIFDWDLVSDRVYVSHRALELFGLPRGELWRPRRDWRHILSFHPDDAPRLHDSIKAHIEGGTPTYDEEFRIVLPGGEVRWFRQRGIALRNASGKAYRVVGSIGDVTQRRRAEEELRTSELERARAEHALRDAREKLAQASKIASLAELSASIAHEINQPLQAVVSAGDASLRWLDAAPPNIDKARRSAERVVRDGRAAAEVVSRIRALFRRAVPEKVDLDINKLILQVRSLMADEIQGNAVSLETGLGEDVPTIRADAVQIQQVIVNLVRNAIEAMATTMARPKPLWIRSRREGGEVVIDVRDHGAGLADPQKVFEPFVTTKKTGMGMGLAICRSIIEAHEGRIWFVRNEDGGTTFSFSLPIVTADAT
jgi:PAS domain S-box-containing protein